MKIRSLNLIGLTLAIMCSLASVILIKRHTAKEASRERAKPPQEAIKIRSKNARTLAPASTGTPSPEDTSASLETALPKSLEAAVKALKPVPPTSDPPPEDELARVALSFVGMDPDAEAYWIDAINDPTLSANERQNLIEDLNEDGLSDPKHPGPEDLPLILSRIELIEELKPYAMDTVNADAFDEALRDLKNLANGGEAK